MIRITVAHNCHGKINTSWQKKITHDKKKRLTAKRKTSRQKEKRLKAKRKRLTAKRKTSWQKGKDSRQKEKPRAKRKTLITRLSLMTMRKIQHFFPSTPKKHFLALKTYTQKLIFCQIRLPYVVITIFLAVAHD